MHYDYVVTLKRENAHKTDLISLLLLIFSLLAFSFVQIQERPESFSLCRYCRCSFRASDQPAIGEKKKGNAIQVLAFRGRYMLDRYAFFTMDDYTIFCYGDDGGAGKISTGDRFLF